MVAQVGTGLVIPLSQPQKHLSQGALFVHLGLLGFLFLPWLLQTFVFMMNSL